MVLRLSGFADTSQQCRRAAVYFVALVCLLGRVPGTGAVADFCYSTSSSTEDECGYAGCDYAATEGKCTVCTGDVIQTNWVTFSGSQYRLVTDLHTWGSAVEHCKTLGGVLASFDSVEEFEWAARQAQDAWIGHFQPVGGGDTCSIDASHTCTDAASCPCTAPQVSTFITYEDPGSSSYRGCLHVYEESVLDKYYYDGAACGTTKKVLCKRPAAFGDWSTLSGHGVAVKSFGPSRTGSLCAHAICQAEGGVVVSVESAAKHTAVVTATGVDNFFLGAGALPHRQQGGMPVWLWDSGAGFIPAAHSAPAAWSTATFEGGALVQRAVWSGTQVLSQIAPPLATPLVCQRSVAAPPTPVMGQCSQVVGLAMSDVVLHLSFDSGTLPTLLTEPDGQWPGVPVHADADTAVVPDGSGNVLQFGTSENAGLQLPSNGQYGEYPTQHFTVCFRVKSGDIEDAGGPVFSVSFNEEGREEGLSGYSIFFDSGDLRFQGYGLNGLDFKEVNCKVSKDDVGDNQWHHVCVVHGADRRVRLYLDGSEEESDSDIDSMSFHGKGNGRGLALVGASLHKMDSFDVSYARKFKMDDLVVFSVSLTEAQIATAMWCGLTATPSPPTPSPPTPMPPTLSPPTPSPPTPVPPTTSPPTPSPPTPSPPTLSPPTPSPPTPSPPTLSPPTPAPVTPSPPTPSPPTPAPPTPSPPTPSPPTPSPPTLSPPTPAPPTPSPPTPSPLTPAPVTASPPSPSPPTPAPPTPSPPTLSPPTPSPPTPLPPTLSPPTPTPVTPSPPTLSPPTLSPPTPAPVTPSPPTPSPPTSSPSTLSPPTPSPSTPSPPTLAPQTQSPATPLPSTSLPPTPSPPTPSPPTPAPPTPAPGTLAPPTSSPPSPSPPTLVPSTSSPPTLAPPTPSPPTTTPLTPSPETSSPATLAPRTPSPPTLSPATLSPPTSPPPTLAPATPSPPTPSPLTSSPATLAPLTPSPPSPSPPSPAPPTRSPATPSPPTPSPTPSPPTPSPPTSSPPTLTPTLQPSTPSPPTSFPPALPPTHSPSGLSPPTGTETTAPLTLGPSPSVGSAHTLVPTGELGAAELGPEQDAVLAPQAMAGGLNEQVYSVVSNGPGQLAVITGNTECLNGGHTIVDMPWALHPTGLRLMGSQAAGCVVGNILITTVWTGILVLGTVWRYLRDHEGGWAAAAQYLRFPSACILVPLFLLPGTADASMLLLAGADVDTLGNAALGCLGLLYTAGLVGLLWACCRPARFTSTVEVAQCGTGCWGSVMRYTYGPKLWVSTAHNHTEGFGIMFENYSLRQQWWVTQYGRYALVETLHIPLTTAVSVIHATTWFGCAMKSFVLAGLFLALAVSVYRHRPFIAPLLNHTVLGASTLSGLGMLGYTVVFLLHLQESVLLLLASFLLLLGMILSLVRTLYDMKLYILDLLRCSVKQPAHMQPASELTETMLIDGDEESADALDDASSLGASRTLELDVTPKPPPVVWAHHRNTRPRSLQHLTTTPSIFIHGSRNNFVHPFSPPRRPSFMRSPSLLSEDSTVNPLSLTDLRSPSSLSLPLRPPMARRTDPRTLVC